MNDLTISATQYTPSIQMKTTGHVVFDGKSYPENTLEFYRPVMTWLKDWLADMPAAALTIEFKIIYFNSSSSKVFFELFDLLDAVKDARSIQIVWHYDVDNENALEAGEDFAADFPELDIRLNALQG